MTPKLNAKNRMDGLQLLASIDDGAAALVIFDPQYREVMEKLAYGNEGARQKERAALPQMPLAMIQRMMWEVDRVLRPSGHVLIWMDKFLLISGRWHRWMPDPSPLREVDGFIWHKRGGRLGMGRRGRGCYEAMAVVQKAPIRAKGVWTDNAFRDVYEAKAPGGHPHAKPVEFTERLIKACTRRGDLVVDPCAGGYGVLAACKATGRKFLGADLAT